MYKKLEASGSKKYALQAKDNSKVDFRGKAGKKGNKKPKVQDWSKFVGKNPKRAAKRIKKQKPGFKVEVIPFGSMVTEDYRLDRIRIFVGEDGKVSRTPVVG